MRELSLALPASNPNAVPVNTLCIYGETRTGKTHWTSTMPRPFVIADVVESGWKTIAEMDRSNWFEPDVEPIVVGVDAMNDVSQLSTRIDQLIASKRIYSIVFDAFTFYADWFLALLIRTNPTADNRQVYGDLGKHLREVRTILGAKGVSVAYNCLVQNPEEKIPTGGPMIPGKSASKFAAGVDFLWHSRMEAKREGGKIVSERREMRTRQYGPYVAGNRLGSRADLLPDPLVGNYADFLACLGYDVEAIRNALPPIGGPATKPPIARPVTKPPASAPKMTITVNTNPAPKATPPAAK